MTPLAYLFLSASIVIVVGTFLATRPRNNNK